MECFTQTSPGTQSATRTSKESCFVDDSFPADSESSQPHVMPDSASSATRATLSIRTGLPTAFSSLLHLRKRMGRASERSFPLQKDRTTVAPFKLRSYD